MLKPIIKTENLEVTYNAGKSNEYRALAIKEHPVEIFHGEYIILFGPSGCGKSTLLYSVLGALPPTGGHMIVKGDDIYAYDPLEMVHYQRSIIGIMYQSFNLIPSLSVRDNVSLPQIFAEVDKPTRDRRAMELLKRFGVDHVAHKLPTNLSGGQMQRVAVSRSLVNDPQILLADEPVGNLDSVSAEQVMNTLEQINREDKKTVILVTHDAKYLPYAHRIYYMTYGKVEREVPNPEKVQIKRVEPGTTIITEIEKLARLYPYSSIDELRVKSIVNYLTQNMNFEQLQKLEKGVEDMIKGRVSDKYFFKLLTKPFLNGGVGILPDEAHSMTEKIKRIMTETRDVSRFRKSMNMDLAFYYQYKYVERLKEYILSENGKHLSEKQQKALEEAISDRVSGFTKRDDFEQKMVLPIEKGGVGLNLKNSYAITRYLEKLLAQGISYDKGKH